MPFITTQQGFRISYEILGDPYATGDRTIVFNHGNGNCLKDWQALDYIEQLESSYRIILMDALGYGQSDKPDDAKEYTAERRAADVITVLDKIGVTKCHFFGNSIGGSLGFVLASLYPQRFLSFTIGSAHPYGSTKPCSNLYDDEAKELLIKVGMKSFVESIEENWLKRQFPSGVRENFIQNDAKAIIIANTPKWPDYSAGLKGISVPVMLFAGEKDPVAKFLPEFSGNIPDCEVRILNGKDHAQTYWEGKIIAKLLNDFLEAKFFNDLSSSEATEKKI